MEKQLYDMVYNWGRVGVVDGHTSPVFQKKLDELMERRYMEKKIKKEGKLFFSSALFAINLIVIIAAGVSLGILTALFILSR